MQKIFFRLHEIAQEKAGRIGCQKAIPAFPGQLLNALTMKRGCKGL
jgi:hypothetical protein